MIEAMLEIETSPDSPAANIRLYTKNRLPDTVDSTRLHPNANAASA